MPVEPDRADFREPEGAGVPVTQEMLREYYKGLK